MLGELSATAIAFVLIAVMVGALVQGSTGFGFAFALAPAMALVLPEAMPATLLLLSLPMMTLMTLRERGSVNVRSFMWITVGRFPGTLIGIWILMIVSGDSLAVLLGALILAGVLISVLGPGFKGRSMTQLVGGFASGVMGTAVGMGSPPLALVNQDRPANEIRATLAASLLIGGLMSLVALAGAGRVYGWHVLFALGLLPGLLLGLWASGFVISFVDKRWLRPAILIFAAGSAVAAIVKDLVT